MLIIKNMAQKSRINLSARWAFDCRSWEPTENDWTRMATGLSAEEKEQVGRFVFKQDAKSAMAGRLLIKRFVAQASGVRWSAISIAREAHGKPFFEQDPAVKFNISHGGEFAVLAGEAPAPGMGLGVDVSFIDRHRLPDFLRLMERQLAPSERQRLADEPAHEARLAAFFRLWCLKESYTKATGTGITVDLSTIDFAPRSPLAQFSVVVDTRVSVAGEPLPAWTFEESMLDEDHVVAVAADRPLPPTLKPFVFLTPAELEELREVVTEPDPTYGQAFMAKKDKPSRI